MSLLQGIINPAQANIMGAIDKGVARQDADIVRQGAAKDRQSTDMAGQILGDTLGGKLGALARMSPDKAMKMAELLGIPTTSKGRLENMMGVTMMGTQLLNAGMYQEAAQFLGEEADKAESVTGEPATRLRMAQQAILSGDQEMVGNFTTAGNSFIQMAQGPPKFSQSTNKDMPGWSFNESTGAYSLDPGYQQFLESDAGRLASKEMLGAKDVSGINDKVTGLVKEAVQIRSAALDLEALASDASQPAVIAAIFKFMKALDPTSAVRENEVHMIEGAEGAAQGIANMYNRLMGQGGMSAEGFAEIVRTAKTLSNSSASASADSVNSYTEVMADNLLPKQLANMRKRVPVQFEIAERAAPATVEGATATNKQGQKIVFTNGQWVSM